ncbi:invasion associated locus B family protein [Methylosinus sp. LW3]|uniref:invasion associated locus B family protein n=1 Tax=Methylosinus sp. LW3 TaxID=107635 RepID=UPI000462FE09|nr:invasion associated locus B family protein [Methylosinus sp. LW3]
MIRPSVLPLLLAAGLGLTVAAPALAKEKPAAEDAAAETKADKKKPAKSEAKKPEAKKAEPAKPGEAKKPDAAKKPADAKKAAEAKKPADAKKAAAADDSEEPDAKPAKDKNGKPAKGGKDQASKDKDAKAGKDKPAEKEKAGAKTPTAIGSYGDWNAMTAHGQGKDKTCYALAEPKDRQPAKLQRDKAYVFISTRPAEGVRNEVAIILGFAAKDGGAASADIDGDNFELVTKGANAWVKNPAKEKEFVEALKNGSKLIVKAPSAKGNATTDTYSLKGLSDALGRVQKECP